MFLALFDHPDTDAVRRRLARLFGASGSPASGSPASGSPATMSPASASAGIGSPGIGSLVTASPVAASPATGSSTAGAKAPATTSPERPTTPDLAFMSPNRPTTGRDLATAQPDLPNTPPDLRNAPHDLSNAPPDLAATSPDLPEAPLRRSSERRMSAPGPDSTTLRRTPGPTDSTTAHPRAADPVATALADDPDRVALTDAEPAAVSAPVDLRSRIAAAFGLNGARLDPGSPGTKALIGLATIVVVVAAGIAWWSQPRPEPVASPHIAAPTAHPSGGATGVVVAVAGKVRHPGLVTLPPGARVADAIKAAGGLLPGTKIGYLNLARKVSDGELIVVGATPPPGGAAAGDPAVPGAPAGKVDLNTATLQQLDTLPGVGPVLAQRILDYRKAHGGFRSVDELRQVDGIGPSRYEQLKDLVSV